MEINAKQARDLMISRNKNTSELPRIIREELDDFFSLIERYAIKGRDSVMTIKLSEQARAYLTKLGYRVINSNNGTNYTTISWSKV